MNPSPADGDHSGIQTKLGPWPDVAAARSFLAFLAGYQPNSQELSEETVNKKELANWSIEQGIGPLTYVRCQEAYPTLAGHLMMERYSAAATNSIHQHNLEMVTDAFAKENISSVLLKGAAIAETIEGGWDRRTMSDIDIWLLEENISQSCQTMRTLGFVTAEKEDRPLALQMMSDGEIQYFRPEFNQGLVELHLSPYPGWWLKRTADVNNMAIWSRIEPVNRGDSVFQLSPEDTIIHIAVHLAVNHQCSLMPVRSLLDIAMTAKSRPLSWHVVVERAKEMRVATAVWIVLSLLQQLIGPPGLDEPLKLLQPPRWRKRIIQRLASPESILLGVDLTSGRMRFLFLLLLVDRKRDMGRLVLRTLWPEKEWLLARYGDSQSHWHHLFRIIRYGQI